METREFRFIKHMLWPVKTTVAVGPEGITNKGILVRWEDIAGFSYGIHSVNRAMNYIIAYEDRNGKGHSLNYLVTVAGRKKRKQMFAELYAMLHEGFTTYCVEPRAKEVLARIQAGETVPLQGCEVSQAGVLIQQGMIRKESVFIPADRVQLSSRPGVGGFHVSSLEDKKHSMLISFQGGTESRLLLAVLNQLYPGQALDVS